MKTSTPGGGGRSYTPGRTLNRYPEDVQQRLFLIHAALVAREREPLMMSRVIWRALRRGCEVLEGELGIPSPTATPGPRKLLGRRPRSRV